MTTSEDISSSPPPPPPASGRHQNQSQSQSQNAQAARSSKATKMRAPTSSSHPASNPQHAAGAHYPPNNQARRHQVTRQQQLNRSATATGFAHVRDSPVGFWPAPTNQQRQYSSSQAQLQSLTGDDCDLGPVGGSPSAFGDAKAAPIHRQPLISCFGQREQQHHFSRGQAPPPLAATTKPMMTSTLPDGAQQQPTSLGMFADSRQQHRTLPLVGMQRHNLLATPNLHNTVMPVPRPPIGLSRPMLSAPSPLPPPYSVEPTMLPSSSTQPAHVICERPPPIQSQPTATTSHHLPGQQPAHNAPPAGNRNDPTNANTGSNSSSNSSDRSQQVHPSSSTTSAAHNIHHNHLHHHQQQQRVLNFLNANNSMQQPQQLNASNFPSLLSPQQHLDLLLGQHNQHHHHHHHHDPTAAVNPLLSFHQFGSGNGVAGISKSRSCFTCADISIKWYIAVIALLGLICALIGTIVGAVHSAGRDYISLALLLIGKLPNSTAHLLVCVCYLIVAIVCGEL